MSPRLRYDTPFTMIDRAVLMHEELSVYDKTVYAILCSYASSKDGSCYPSYQTIARKAGCSRRKVISVIANLERLGLVEKQEQFNSVGDNTSNLYWPVHPVHHQAVQNRHYPMQIIHYLMQSIHPNEIH